MYTFKTDIPSSAHDEYITSTKDCNLLQSSRWAKLKDNWGSIICGVYDDDKLVMSSLILIKVLPLHFCMMYIPKGPIMDYTNKELVKFYFTELRKWAKKQKCLFVTFDPSVKYRTFTLDAKDKADDPEALETIETLRSLGCIYKGRTMSISQTIQPRFHMGVPYTEDLEHHVYKETLKSYKTALKRHVYGDVYDSSHVKEFAKMIELTEQKKNVHLRNYDYFKKIMDIYGDNAVLYLAKVDPSLHEKELLEEMEEAKRQLENKDNITHNAIKKNEQIIATNTKELEKMKPILKKYPHETVIAGGLMVGYGKTIEMMYAGRNDDFKSFRPQYLLYMNKIHYAFDHGYTFANMGGVEGSLEDGLSTFKANFNPTVVEFIGEFDYPVMPLLYKAAKFAQKLKTGK